jgi:hypothetical protein
MVVPVAVIMAAVKQKGMEFHPSKKRPALQIVTVIGDDLKSQ